MIPILNTSLINNLIMQNQSSLVTNEVRINKLEAQRVLQVKRDGILISLQVPEQFCGMILSINQSDRGRLETLLFQEKYGLQICLQNGRVLMRVFPTQIREYYANCYIVDLPSFARNIHHNDRCYLMKSNPSNSVHKSALLNAESSNITDFIEQRSLEIKDPQQKIYFDQQYDLNQSQNLAIKKVGLHSLTFIKGPPGCGKTRLIGRLCKLLYLEKQKIIAGAVSNTGNLRICNEVLKALVSQKAQQWIRAYIQNIYRNPWLVYQASEAVKPKIVLYTTLQTAQQNGEYEPITRYFSLNQWLLRNMCLLNNDQDITLEQLTYGLDLIATKTRNSWGVFKKIYSLYKQALQKTVDEADIIIVTTVSAAKIQGISPDVAIIDEASQAAWADTYCYFKYPIKRMVLVGDDKQLDPTVISQDKVLKETVFNKHCYKNLEYYVILDTQYRMHPQISSFPSHYFYNGQLKNGVTVQQRCNTFEFFAHNPISFIDHRIAQQYTEQLQNGKKNYFNSEEIKIMGLFLSFFPHSDLRNVGIIAPYSLQVKKITDHFQYYIKECGLTVKSCDGYQGGQKDFIIFSCVRSNQQRKVGFCGQKNRINVSLTRAKKALLIIGNSHTLTHCSELTTQENVWYSLISYLYMKGKIYPAPAVMSYYQHYNAPGYSQSPFEYQKDNSEQATRMNYGLSNYGDQSDHFSFQNYVFEDQSFQSQQSNQSMPHYPFEKSQLLPKHSQVDQQTLPQAEQIYLNGQLTPHSTQKIEASRDGDFDKKLLELKQISNDIKTLESEQSQQLEGRNKKMLKQIRKLLETLVKQPDISSIQTFRAEIVKIIAIDINKQNLQKKITVKLHQQAVQLAQKEKNQAKIVAEAALYQYISEILISKKIANHLERMQACYLLLRKTLLYYLIKQFL